MSTHSLLFDHNGVICHTSTKNKRPNKEPHGSRTPPKKNATAKCSDAGSSALLAGDAKIKEDYAGFTHAMMVASIASTRTTFLRVRKLVSKTAISLMSVVKSIVS
jgi:hypothetical protein